MIIPVLVAASAAIAILLIFFGLAGALGHDRTMDERLGRYASVGGSMGLVDEETERRMRASILARRLEAAVEETTWAEQTAAKLMRADLRLTVGEFTLAKLIAVFAAFAVGLFLGRASGALALLFGLLFALPGFFIPDMYAAFAARRRMTKFNEQLGDAIMLLGNSLRSGYSLLQSIELVARESPAPMAQEFTRVVREVGLGITYQDAMNNMLSRIPSDDLDLLITAINIQHEVGGNLAQILDTIGQTIRERVRIKGEISVMTAQAQISGYVISLMPIALGVTIYIVNPSYLTTLFAWPWICMPIGASVFMVAGFVIMRKIIAIEV